MRTPAGPPSVDDFAGVEDDIPEVGELVVENAFISVDPFMR